MSKLASIMLAIWISTPVIAEDWNYYSITPEQVAPMIRQCLVAARLPSDREKCVGQFSEPCANERPDFRRCYSIEAGAWEIVLDEEFKMTLIDAIQQDENSKNARPYYKRRAETLCRAQAAWESYLKAECDSQRAISGAGSIGQDYAAACRHSETSERVLSVRRTRALILTQGDADLEAHRDRVSLSTSELQDTYGFWCDLDTGELK